jgi:SAM-dependent methyltransferase
MNRTDSCILCHAHISRSVPEFAGYRACMDCDVAWSCLDDPTDHTSDKGDWDKDYYGDDKVFQFHQTRKSAFEAIIARLRGISPNRGRLLDVGTGLGFLIDAAAKDGWQVEGIEPSESAAEWARKLTGSTVHTGFLEDVKLAEGQYHVITMVDVLRTVPDPLTFLHSARRLLRPGGVLLIRESNWKIKRSTSMFGLGFGMRLQGNAVGQSQAAIRRGVDSQIFSPKSLLYALQKIGLVEGWVEPSPVFVEQSSARGGSLLIPILKRVVGMASSTLYQVSGRRIILSPNVLAFGRAPSRMV